MHLFKFEYTHTHTRQPQYKMWDPAGMRPVRGSRKGGWGSGEGIHLRTPTQNSDVDVKEICVTCSHFAIPKSLAYCKIWNTVTIGMMFLIVGEQTLRNVSINKWITSTHTLCKIQIFCHLTWFTNVFLYPKEVKVAVVQ